MSADGASELAGSCLCSNPGAAAERNFISKPVSGMTFSQTHEAEMQPGNNQHLRGSAGVRRTIATTTGHNVRLESFGRGHIVAGLRWMWSGGKSSGGSKIQSMEVFSVLKYSTKKPPISQPQPAFSSLSPLLSGGECAAIDQKPGPFCSASD